MAKIILGDWGTYYSRSGTSNPDSSIGDFQGRFKVSYEQDLANAITKIYVQPYIKIATVIGSLVNVPNLTMKSTINGTSKNQTISGASYSTDRAGINYYYKYGVEQEFTIQHDSNGQAQCTLNGLMSGSGVSKSCSHTWALPSINVRSTITNNTSEISKIDFGQAVTFSISRPNTSTTHTLSYSINGINYTIGTAIADSTSYIFPVNLISNFPNNSEVTILVTCLSNNGTSSITPVYLKVPDSYVPVISLNVSDVGSVPSNWGIYVKSKSKIKGVVTASGSGGSTIKRYLTNINNQNFSTSEFTSSELNIAGNVLINSSVTDTRDRVANTSQTIVVHDYATPTFIKLEVLRCNEEGEADNNGTFGKVVCQYSISPCNNYNNKILKVSYGSVEKTFTLSEYYGTVNATVEQLFSDLDVAFNHTFNFKLIDSFNENGIEQSYVMPPSFVLVSKRVGGKGITFGQIATEDGFHCYLDSIFHKLIHVEDSFFESKLSEDFSYVTGMFIHLPFNQTITASKYIINNPVNGYIQVAEDCTLLINCGLQFSNVDVSYLSIYVNDVQHRNSYSNSQSHTQATYILSVKKNDVIDMRYYNNASCTIVNNDFTYLQIAILN